MLGGKKPVGEPQKMSINSELPRGLRSRPGSSVGLGAVRTYVNPTDCGPLGTER